LDLTGAVLGKEAVLCLSYNHITRFLLASAYLGDPPGGNLFRQWESFRASTLQHSRVQPVSTSQCAAVWELPEDIERSMPLKFIPEEERLDSLSKLIWTALTQGLKVIQTKLAQEQTFASIFYQSGLIQALYIINPKLLEEEKLGNIYKTLWLPNVLTKSKISVAQPPKEEAPESIYKTLGTTFREANDQTGVNEAWYLQAVAERERNVREAMEQLGANPAPDSQAIPHMVRD
jgi:hypothetical protein